MSSLTPEAYAVIEGRHSDPFRYFGPHVENDSSVVRVFLPDAEGVAIVDEQGKPRRKPCAFGRIAGSPPACSAGCELAPHHPLTILPSLLTNLNV
jgi:hypothetical protein